MLYYKLFNFIVQKRQQKTSANRSRWSQTSIQRNSSRRRRRRCRRRRMYIYHALIKALSAHMLHVNLNMIFYTHVEHSPTKTTHTNHQTERQTTPLSIHPPTHKKHNQARARTERVRLRRPRHVRAEEPVFGKVPNCKALATAYSYHALFTAR